MDDGELRRRGTSFGGVAGHYERARPGYPAAAIRWMVGETRTRVLDLGAGTGKLTRGLVALDHDVVACEPLAEMARALAESIPAVPVVRGRAERLPCARSSFDIVTAAQAFHWFQPEPSLREIARVLRPGGRIGLVWNLRDEDVGWVRRMSEIIGSETIEADEPWRVALASSNLFGDLAESEFRYEQVLTLADLLSLVRSRSYWAVSGASDQQRMLDEMTELIRAHSEIDEEAISLPYRTMAFRAVRT